jgi:glycosyltransferase involved in cell wall biosynthesis
MMPSDSSTPPRVLILHNRYRQPGGEDAVVAAQAELLRQHGHAVRVLEKDNREIDRYGLVKKAVLFLEMAGSARSAREVDDIAKVFEPAVALVHNTLPLLSPSIYAPLKRRGVKVIQWLHNFRLVCAAGTLYRAGRSCTLCVDDGLKHAVNHRCWNESTFASLGVTRMLERHRRAKTWHTQVDLFVALNSYQREMLLKANVVPESKIIVQPNFLLQAPAPAAASPVGEGFVYAGRLTPEKGIATLLKAHAQLATPAPRLTILGDGPLRGTLVGNEHVEFLGHRPKEEVLERLRTARAVVVPSEWHEGFPLSIIEAMAMGRPVIASRMAGPLEIVQDGITGLLFEAGNAEELAKCLRRLHSDKQLAENLGRAGQERFKTEYTADAGYRRLLENFARVGCPTVL